MAVLTFVRALLLSLSHSVDHLTPPLTLESQVDGLHHKAVDTNLSTYLSPQTKPPSNILPPPVPDPPILELHGTLRHAHCLSCDAPVGRDAFQDRLSELNPEWAGYLDEVMRGERQEKLNPDGDVELGEGVRYEEFVVPECQRCGGPMKPVSFSSRGAPKWTEPTLPPSHSASPSSANPSQLPLVLSPPISSPSTNNC